jgi:hypothetical protein
MASDPPSSPSSALVEAERQLREVEARAADQHAVLAAVQHALLTNPSRHAEETREREKLLRLVDIMEHAHRRYEELRTRCFFPLEGIARRN